MSSPKSHTILPLHERTLRSQSSNNASASSKPRDRASLTRSSQQYKTHQSSRHARVSFIPNRLRNEAIAFIAELCGTFMFLFFAFGSTQLANAAAQTMSSANSASQGPNASSLQYISLAFGFSLAANVWIFFRISGGLFNPAVSLALYLVSAITGVRAVVCFVAQIVGGICAAAVVSAILPGPLNVSTALGGGTSIARGLFLEMFLTTELTLAILFLAAEKHKSTFLAPVGIGLAFFIAELMGVYYTGGSLNPARSFGPAVVTGTFHGYHWIYWLGPVMGACLATGFYKLMKYGEYETVNPGQDFNDHEAQLFSPPEDALTAADVARPDPIAIAAQEAAAQVAQELMPQVTDELMRMVSSDKSGESRDSTGSGRELARVLSPQKTSESRRSLGSTQSQERTGSRELAEEKGV